MTSSTFSGRVFECRTCCRQFASFQALGGHRASHKKPRLSDGRDHQRAEAAKAKAHECSICGLEFVVGQALGGHMRRHRVVGHGYVEKKSSANGKRVLLDLNLPPLEENIEERKLTLELGLVCR